MLCYCAYVYVVLCCFFKQKTAYEMRISDWSSDVCSSDLCFESKYALCLYEMIERRIGLEYKQSEEFTIAELRRLLNVPEGKLERFTDFNKYCLKVAQEEINKLCHFWVEFTPIKKGRKVERVSMMWLPKTMSARRDEQPLIAQNSIVQTGRATCRERVGQAVSSSVDQEVLIKKEKKN